MNKINSLQDLQQYFSTEKKTFPDEKERAKFLTQNQKKIARQNEILQTEEIQHLNQKIVNDWAARFNYLQKRIEPLERSFNYETKIISEQDNYTTTPNHDGIDSVPAILTRISELRASSVSGTIRTITLQYQGNSKDLTPAQKDQVEAWSRYIDYIVREIQERAEFKELIHETTKFGGAGLLITPNEQNINKKITMAKYGDFINRERFDLQNILQPSTNPSSLFAQCGKFNIRVLDWTDMLPPTVATSLDNGCSHFTITYRVAKIEILNNPLYNTPENQEIMAMIQEAYDLQNYQFAFDHYRNFMTKPGQALILTDILNEIGDLFIIYEKISDGEIKETHMFGNFIIYRRSYCSNIFPIAILYENKQRKSLFADAKNTAALPLIINQRNKMTQVMDFSSKLTYHFVVDKSEIENGGMGLDQLKEAVGTVGSVIYLNKPEQFKLFTTDNKVADIHMQHAQWLKQEIEAVYAISNLWAGATGGLPTQTGALKTAMSRAMITDTLLIDNITQFIKRLTNIIIDFFRNSHLNGIIPVTIPDVHPDDLKQEELDIDFFKLCDWNVVCTNVPNPELAAESDIDQLAKVINLARNSDPNSAGMVSMVDLLQATDLSNKPALIARAKNMEQGVLKQKTVIAIQMFNSWNQAVAREQMIQHQFNNNPRFTQGMSDEEKAQYQNRSPLPSLDEIIRMLMTVLSPATSIQEAFNMQQVFIMNLQKINKIIESESNQTSQTTKQTGGGATYQPNSNNGVKIDGGLQQQQNQYSDQSQNNDIQGEQ